MKNIIRMIVFILLFILIEGCSVSESNIKTKIFTGIDAIIIHKLDPPNYYKTIIEGEELSIIIKDIRNIKKIHEYSSDAALFGGFREGFHGLFIHKKEKQEKSLIILYSIENSSMIIRKCDLFPDTKVKLPNITVYEFKITKDIVEILNKHENMLPKSGFFITTWPDNYY